MFMSKKFKKFMLFAAASAAVGSALVYMDKKRKAEEEPLFEDEDTNESSTDAVSHPACSSTSKTSRTYINLV